MHGVKRVYQSVEAVEARRKQEEAKLQAYLSLTNNVLARKKQKDWSMDALNLTTRLLQQNPELYTVWNYRRDVLLNGIFKDAECTTSDVNDALNMDLDMTYAFLQQHPKVYWIWNHRRWCLENVPNGPTDEDSHGWRNKVWKKELRAVEMMLDIDSRNFHAWNYRRYVLASIPNKLPETTELEYTTKKIESNFSNFSAWHQRSKVYTSLWNQGVLDERESKEKEFELVKQALYVDPFDQSSWIYHRWLIGSGDDRVLLEREIGVIEELKEIEPECKWCLESLAYYKRLLLEKHLTVFGAESDSTAREKERRECLASLQTLESIDPFRARRYRELAQNL